VSSAAAHRILPGEEEEPRSVIDLVAAIRSVDAARDRLHAADVRFQGDTDHAYWAQEGGIRAFAVADAWDDAIRPLRRALPDGVLPPPLHDGRPAVSMTTRQAALPDAIPTRPIQAP
jgi:hypothetical protein